MVIGMKSSEKQQVERVCSCTYLSSVKSKVVTAVDALMKLLSAVDNTEWNKLIDPRWALSQSRSTGRVPRHFGVTAFTKT
ncbi:hypothetical protein TNCV_5050381 [Trichonephila clavipes]|nr:hypothetical protein TNCV_5050381 [Trichonephila clavipes]